MQVSQPQLPDGYRPDQKSEQPQKVNWWLRVTSSGWDRPQETIEQREKTRRSRLISWILLGVLVSLILFIPAAFKDRASAFSVAGAFVGVFIIIQLNHRGLITVSGIALVLLSSAATISVLIGSADGKIHLVYLPAYDFLVVPIVLGAAILPRSAVFPTAFINVGLIYGDLLLQSKAQDLLDAINSYGSYQIGFMIITGRPVAILVITAVIAYIWVRGMDQALRRADRAEELRNIELYFTQQESERTTRVEEFVQEMIRAISALANGQEGMMLLPGNHPWQQQAIFINTQLRQFHRLKQANRGDLEMLYFSLDSLARQLQLINGGQASVANLDQHHFRTQIPLINEIARYLFFMLQGKRAPVTSSRPLETD